MDIKTLKCGDVLLYRPHTFFGWLIALKTFCKTAAHVEVYLGDGKSVASRDGIGVGLYNLRIKQLSIVLRPTTEFKIHDAMNYLMKVNHQPYDWKGILIFGLLAERGEDGKQICSEFVRNVLRAGGVECFNPLYPSEKVPPSFFLTSTALRNVA